MLFVIFSSSIPSVKDLFDLKTVRVAINIGELLICIWRVVVIQGMRREIVRPIRNITRWHGDLKYLNKCDIKYLTNKNTR